VHENDGKSEFSKLNKSKFTHVKLDREKRDKFRASIREISESWDIVIDFSAL
jgi:hypothetical protein